MKSLILYFCTVLVMLAYGSTSEVGKPTGLLTNFWNIFLRCDTVCIVVSSKVDVAESLVMEMYSGNKELGVQINIGEEIEYVGDGIVKSERSKWIIVPGNSDSSWLASFAEKASFMKSLQQSSFTINMNEYLIPSVVDRLHKLLSDGKSVWCSLCSRAVCDYPPEGYSSNDEYLTIFRVLVPQKVEVDCEFQTGR